MPGIEKAIYEVNTAAGVGAVAMLAAVPAGKRRIVLRCDAVHDVAGSSFIIFHVSQDVALTRTIVVQSSMQGWSYGAGLPGDVPPLIYYPLINVPLLLAEGEILAATCLTGAGDSVTIAAHYVEWYYKHEAVPWQALLLKS